MPIKPDPILLALGARAGYETVSKTETPGKLRLIGRVPPDPGRTNRSTWNAIQERLLVAELGRPWTLDLSSWRFIKSKTAPVKQMVYAERLILQADNVAQYYEEIAALILSVPRAQPAIAGIPLAGADPDLSNVSGGRRGAGPTGSVAVGPAAIRQKLLGG